MRAVRSRVLFEQMLGRGTRVISETDFQSVTTTPNARKTRFVIVDAVGVTEQELIDTGTVERKRSVPLKSLLESVAVGAVDDDLLASLARRLALLEKRLTPAQREEVADLLDVPAAPQRFTTLQQLSNALLDALDPDCIYAAALAGAGLDPALIHPIHETRPYRGGFGSRPPGIGGAGGDAPGSQPGAAQLPDGARNPD